jgi:Flp pilus assembly protein TadD
MNIATTMASSSSSSVTPGVAGRINYAQWDKVANELEKDVDKEELEEIAQQKAALGLDGKYARSQSEAEERKKAKDVAETKKVLENYKKRENQAVQNFKGLLGPVPGPEEETTEKALGESKTNEKDATVVRITRDRMDAGRRVLSLTDTSGFSQKDTIVLTQDLSLLESKMAARMTPKKYGDDAENAVTEPEAPQQRSIYGLIKVFIQNVHNCTVLVKCKIITGTLELHNCSNVVVKIDKDATVATIQADLSEDITFEFNDAPSGKNTMLPGKNMIYWGQDRDDRIFHAGVKSMRVRVVRDGFVETERVADYIKDGATAPGNATLEEFQFVTSVVNGELSTEKVVRAGSTTGKNTRAMTERELEEERITREKAATMAIAMAEDMIKIQDKDGNEIKKIEKPAFETVDDEDIEEIYASMTKVEIDEVVEECELNKQRGNEAFGSGEYAQAILLYSLALDKAEELPDNDSEKKLFPRDVVFCNRAACFLKLGQHEKALVDAVRAKEINPGNLKAVFREGLSLHAAGRYREALPVLAEAHKVEPNNKQIKQALQFCEVRFEKENRKRMGK